MKIVSFTGPKGSGKDTAASILAEAGISQGKISFAGPMKEICSRVLAIPLETFEDPKLKEKPFNSPLALTESLVGEIVYEMFSVLNFQEFHYPESFQTPDNLVATSPRHVLQLVGTDLIRNNIGADWHVAAAFSKAALSKLDPNGLYCVTDARFANEYLWLKNRFDKSFVGFYVERPEAETVLSTATHMSELAVKDVRALIPAHLILKNNSSIENLEKQTVEQLRSLYEVA